MPLSVRPSPTGFGAEIFDLDLRQPVDAALFDEIEGALSAHGVLSFRAQPIEDEHQQALVSWFGPPNVVTAELNNASNTNPYFYDVGNVDENGGRDPPAGPCVIGRLDDCAGVIRMNSGDFRCQYIMPRW